MGDAGSWTMALLAILLAAPVTAAVAVLVAMVAQGSGGSILASEPSGETSSAAPLPSETPIKRGRRTSTATPGRRITSLSIFPSQAELHDRIDEFLAQRWLGSRLYCGVDFRCA